MSDMSSVIGSYMSSFSPRETPLWGGPEQDGITSTLLKEFLVCRERFRIHTIEGLRVRETWNHKLGYGNMWHVCEEWYSGYGGCLNDKPDGNIEAALRALRNYCQDQCKLYPLQQEEIQKWYNVCKREFPLYLDFWAHHPEQGKKQNLLSEAAFDVPYKLPSGRVVRLRGKWDSVDLVDGGIWLQENKTKGNPKPEQIKRQLRMDLQTMLYLVAMEAYLSTSQRSSAKTWLKRPIAGIRYSVVRRPLSGGEGTIIQGKGTPARKCIRCNGTGMLKTKGCSTCDMIGVVPGKPPETDEDYYARMIEYVAKAPETYFMRWNVHISQADIDKFKKKCLDPILEQVCHWYDIVVLGEEVGLPSWATNFQMPYGVYSPLLDSNRGSTDLDDYLSTGSTVGLGRVTTVFPELDGASS